MIFHESHCRIFKYPLSFLKTSLTPKDPSIAALVTDTCPAEDLTTVAAGVVAAPLAGLCRLVRRGEDGEDAVAMARPLEIAKSCFVPGFFLHAQDDEIVPSEAAKQLRNNYGGEAQMQLMAKCTHNSDRPNASLARAALFLARGFDLENLAVSQLDAYLTKLAAPDPGNKIDLRAEQLLSSTESEKRRWGLFIKAVNACPSYHDVAFHRVLARGQQSADYARYCFLVKLPSLEGEVCVAWASDFPCGQRVGMIHFLIMSCTSLSLTRAVVRKDEKQHRVTLHDLAIKDLGLFIIELVFEKFELRFQNLTRNLPFTVDRRHGSFLRS